MFTQSTLHFKVLFFDLWYAENIGLKHLQTVSILIRLLRILYFLLNTKIQLRIENKSLTSFVLNLKNILYWPKNIYNAIFLHLLN